MVMMMSKTNDTSRPATLDDHSTLADSELSGVLGMFSSLEVKVLYPT
jgi:hypothetical protein